MGGRELRAGLVFVLVSLALGTAVRSARRAHETRFQEIVDRLEEADLSRLEREAASARSAGDGPGSVPAPAAVPTPRGEGTPSRSGRRAPRAPSPPPLRPASIDVDRADAAALERLPGIGPALAARIVADRAERGPFGGPDGLRRVPGIGPKTLQRIRPYLASAPGGAAVDTARAAAGASRAGRSGSR